MGERVRDRVCKWVKECVIGHVWIDDMVCVTGCVDVSFLTRMQIEHLAEQLFLSNLHRIDEVRLTGEVADRSHLNQVCKGIIE